MVLKWEKLLIIKTVKRGERHLGRRQKLFTWLNILKYTEQPPKQKEINWPKISVVLAEKSCLRGVTYRVILGEEEQLTYKG